MIASDLTLSSLMAMVVCCLTMIPAERVIQENEHCKTAATTIQKTKQPTTMRLVGHLLIYMALPYMILQVLQIVPSAIHPEAVVSTGHR